MIKSALTLYTLNRSNRSNRSRYSLCNHKHSFRPLMITHPEKQETTINICKIKILLYRSNVILGLANYKGFKRNRIESASFSILRMILCTVTIRERLLSIQTKRIQLFSTIAFYKHSLRLRRMQIWNSFISIDWNLSFKQNWKKKTFRNVLRLHVRMMRLFFLQRANLLSLMRFFFV